MAKDGTARGGQRVGAGRKAAALTDKIADGRLNGLLILQEPEKLEGVDVPDVKDYLKAVQKNGKDLCAEDVYIQTYKWLKERSCEMLVNHQLIEQYAMSISRWIQCEECVSEYGFLAKHPTTSAAIASPYVAMSREYMKQANQCWYQIYQIVKENCSVGFVSRSPEDSFMEQLLSAQERKIHNEKIQNM